MSEANSNDDRFIRRVQAVTVAIVAVMFAMAMLGAFGALVYSMFRDAEHYRQKPTNQTELQQHDQK